LRFIESQDFNTNIAKGYIDHQFVLSVCSTRLVACISQSLTLSSCLICLIQKTHGSVISSRQHCIASMANS
jgi:hypothetical protein